MTQRRAASSIEYLAIIALLALGAIGAFLHFSRAAGSSIRCQGAQLLTFERTCEGAPASPTPASAASITSAALTSSSGMTCTALGCTGNGNCFVAGTPVAVPSGHVAIERLREGDRVIARDESTGQLEPRLVVGTTRTPARALVELEIASEHGTSTVRVTPEHPFYVAGRGWTGAGGLDVGVPLVSTSGLAVVVRLTSLERGDDVFNIEVEGLHTYFVGQADAWVHNDCNDAKPRIGMPIAEPRLRVLAPGQEGAGENGGFALQRRAMVGGEKIVGEPTASVDDPQAASREARGAEIFAKRPDVKEVYLGAEAERYLRGLAERRGTPFQRNAKIPDVVGVKKDGALLLGEGKGLNAEHAGKQFESVGRQLGSEAVAEQWVFTPDKPTDYVPGKGGFLEEVFLRTEPGEATPKAQLDAARKSGVMLETRTMPDGSKEYVRLWKPNGRKVQYAITEELPPNTPTVGEPVVETTTTSPKPVAETATPRPIETPAVPVTTPNGARPLSTRLGFVRAGGPSVGVQLKAQGAGIALAVVATTAGKVVEKETGSPIAGTATTLTVAGTGAALLARAAGGSVVKGVGGSLVGGLAGSFVREGVKYGGGSQTAGDVAGYATAGAVGAAFGGPIGAGGAVIAMAASDAAAAGVDCYYAGKEGRQLDAVRQLAEVQRAFFATQNRDILKEGVNIDYWKNLAKTPEGTATMYERLADANGPSGDVIRKIWTTHLEREPTPAEMQASIDALRGRAWLGDIEKNVILIQSAYASILGRSVDAGGMTTWLGQLRSGMSREQFLAHIATSDEAKRVITNLYGQRLGRVPTADELRAAENDLASGIGLNALDAKLRKP